MELSMGCRLSSRLCDQRGFLPTSPAPRHPLLDRLLCRQGGKAICTLGLTFAPLCGPTAFPVILTSSPAGLIFIFCDLL